MSKVIQGLVAFVALLVLLGTLGVGIAVLVTVLNIQTKQNELVVTESPSVVPLAEPINQADPRYATYNQMSSLLKSWMNSSVSPCDDFYAFTCGGATPDQLQSFYVSDDAITELLATELRKPLTEFSAMAKPVQQMKWFFDQCVAFQPSPEQQSARAVGKFDAARDANPDVPFPLLFSNEAGRPQPTPNQLARYLGFVVAQQGLTTLVDVGVDTDWKAPTSGYALLVDQPVTMYTPAFYGFYDNYKEQIIAEVQLMIEQSAALLNVSIDATTAHEQAGLIAQLDYSLATTFSTDETTRRSFDRMYNPRTIGQLQALAPFLDWTAFVETALSPIGANITEAYRVIVMEPERLAQLSAAVVSGKIDSDTLCNYLYLLLLNNNYLPNLSQLSHTTSSRADVVATMHRDRRPIDRKRQPPVTRRRPSRSPAATSVTVPEASCIGQTTNYLSWANTRLFVDARYPTATAKQAIRDQANDIIRSILVAFRAQIDLLDWMTPASKRGAYQKIDNLVVNNAFPDWVLDDARLSDYYKLLTTVATDDYYKQLDALTAFSLYSAFSPLLVEGAADRTDFGGPASVTNAWYQPEANSITLPGGILHEPFYDVAYPAAINYGGLGVIVGHELTHGFDDQGVQWEGTGFLSSWMDNSSTSAFNSMAQCVIDEYSGFCPIENACVNGAQTQGENIADNGGIQAAYKAFKAYEALNGPDPLLPADAAIYTADQLFFLGFAQVWCQYPESDAAMFTQLLVDVHSPSVYRVLGTIRNLPAFKKAFNCPDNSVYAPSKHCDVWTSKPDNGAPLNARGEPIVPDNELNIAPVERISPSNMAKYDAYQASLATFKANTNLTVDPCDDFYKYGCGSFSGPSSTFYDMDSAIDGVISVQLELPAYQAQINASKALSKLRTLYDACKAEALEPTIGTTNYLAPKVDGFLKAINQSLPLFGGSVPSGSITESDYGSVLGYLSFVLGLNTLVTPVVDTNWMEPSAGYQLFVDQPSTYHVRAFYEDDTWAVQKDGYLKTVTTVVEAYAKSTALKLATDYMSQIDQTLELEKVIALRYTRTDEQDRTYAPQWNLLTLEQFPQTVDWQGFWSAAPSEARNWAAANLTVLNNVELTPQLFTTGLKDMDAQVVNYLFIRVLLANTGLIPCLSAECERTLGEIAASKPHLGRIGKRLSGRRVALPRFTRLEADEATVGSECAGEVAVVADAQGRVYVDYRLPTQQSRDTLKTAALGVMNNIIDAMKGMIMSLDWMDDESKRNAVVKASNIQVNVAYPDYITDDALLDAKYADLAFDDGDAYFNMLDKVTVFSIKDQYKLLAAGTANREDFLGQTAVVNAWYEPELNSITLPAGILQQPFFDVNYPAANNYGGLGVVTGHELTHGFDDEGVQWDFDGRLNRWMTNSSQAGFDNMASCVIEEYSNFCPLPGSTPNCTDGVRTQGENIADNGGMHSAWRAYQAHVELDGPDPLFRDRAFSAYTENQLYFLNFAQVWCMAESYMTDAFISTRLLTDPHSLSPYRVEGTLRNMPAFQAAYNCPLGSTYAPEQHCRVWVPQNMP